MSRIVAVHAFRGDTDKSNVTASLANAVALRGKRVGVVDTAYDTTPEVVKQAGGRVYRIPPGVQVDEISQVLRQTQDIGLLNDGFRKVIQALDLDVLFVDARAGLDEESLRPMAIADVLVIVLHPDSEDFQGTSVIVEVARKLNVPRMCLVLSQIQPPFDRDAVKKQVEETYHCPVAAILPGSEAKPHLDGVLKGSQPPPSPDIESLADFVLTE